MRHYIPLQLDNGTWGVCYANHRGEFTAVMECPSLQAAYAESEAMTLDATKRALCGATPVEAGGYINTNGNRYLRKVQ